MRASLAGLVEGRAGDLLALVGGALIPLAFAPFELFPVAPVALALLFVLWLHATPRRAAWRGWLFGLGMFGLGASWVHESFEFSEVAMPVAVILTALFVFSLTLFPAITGYLLARFSPGHSRARLLGFFPAAWVLAEWVRGWFLTGFPWLNLGYSQVSWPLAGFSAWLGVYGVSWAVTVTAGLAAAVLVERKRWGYGLALVLLWGGGWLAGRVAWTEPAGPVQEVVLVQGNVAQDLKWLPEQRGPTLALYLSLTRQHWGVDLVLWPETAVPAYFHVAEPLLDELREEAHGHGTELLVGVPVKDLQSGRYYNSVVALGEHSGVYRKRHLVPFGEYLPLVDILGPIVDLMKIPMSDFSAGPPEQPLLQVAGQRVGVSVCYEDAFGEEIIKALPDATLLVNVSNDAWFGDSIAPAQHLQMARMRAMETGRYLLRATNNGISAIIGPTGDVLARSPQFETHALRGTVQGMTGMTPYAGLGNWAVVTALIGLLCGLAWALSRRRD